jgi:hypothetical protein
MRSPQRKRPMRREIIAAPEGIALDELASRVRYVGSSEHKSFPSFAGPPKMRADATKCDPHLTDPEEITAWLRGGVEAGHIGAPWEGDFPRYVWAQVQGIYYEARLVNRGSGGYKGWSVEASEFPKAIR